MPWVLRCGMRLVRKLNMPMPGQVTGKKCSVNRKRRREVRGLNLQYAS